MIIRNLSISLLSWLLGSILALYFRYESNVPVVVNKSFLSSFIFFFLIFILISEVDKIFFGGSQNLTFEEFLSNTRKFLLTGVTCSLIISTFSTFSLPKSYPILSAILSLGIFLSTEKILRIFGQHFNLISRKIPVAIYGAGAQGKLLIEKILNDSKTNWFPTLIIDDFLDTSIKKINGVKLVNGNNLSNSLTEFKVSILIVSFSKISSKKLQELKSICDSKKIELLIIPPIKAITGNEFNLQDIRMPSREELIGKTLLNLDLREVSKLIANKIVLITGAGGSIGSELTRQVINFSPKQLFLLDRDESALLDANLSISNNGSIAQDQLILADIRDDESMNSIFARIRPQIVFHAAALKHLTLLENFPAEAVKTNIIGTINLLNASVKTNVETFINISTDKAADPISILGKTKLFAEKITTQFGQTNSSYRYFSVRFGNVFASRGSVLHTFQRQIQTGGPVTITTPGVTRFFMTIEDAVHLVLKSATKAKTGETYILNMGEPILIEEIAKKLIEASGKPIEITFNKLRKGEKLHEVLVGHTEKLIDSSDSEIFVVRSEPLNLNYNNLNYMDLVKLI